MVSGLSNCAELSNLKRSLTEQVKNFLTATTDIFRPPYGRHTERVPRTNVFAGSVNNATYLMDETGNRRFWPVRCRTLNIAALARDRDQLWAEAYARFKNGDPWWLESKELEKLATEEQEQRYEEGVWDNVIQCWLEDPRVRRGFDPESEPFDSEIGRVTITDVLLHAIGKELKNHTQVDKLQVARCLTHIGWERKQVRIRERRVWCYVASGSPEVQT
jgi:putative DNA primase/helicase